MPKIIIANEGAAPPSEGTGKSVLFTKSDGLYVVLESGTVVGPLAGPFSMMAGGALTGTYPNPGLANNTVTTGKILNGAVTGAKLDPTLSDPSGATAGLRTLGTGATQAAAGNDPRFTDSRAPSGAASGDLAGSYPAPVVGRLRGRLLSTAAPLLNQVLAWDGTAWTPTTFAGGSGITQLTGEVTATGPGVVAATIANLAVTAAKIANATITDTQVAAANKDGSAGTASMRTLGTGATQACAGNDARLSDSRTPSGSAGGDLAGSYPNPSVAKLQGYAVQNAAPSDGQTLVWSATNSRWEPKTPVTKELHFTFNETVTGASPASPLLIGSVYLETGTTLQTTSRAMIGGASGSDKAVLQLRRFTGGATFVTFVAVPGTLQNVSLASSAAVPASDWYDVYLYESGGGTSIAKGLKLSF